MRALSKIVVTGAVMAAALGVGIGTALADPSASPATTDIVGVGSDTTTFLFNQFSTDYNGTISSTTPHLYSWNATGSTTIQSKGTAGTDTNCAITRPNGSGAGISTLSKGLLAADGNPCVDFARSSRATTSSDPTGFVFDAFARDAITWSASSTGHAPSGASLTLAQLGEIYSCNNTATTDGGWRWSDFFTGASTDEIVPILPQTGSGTRAQFLTDIGVTTPGACVINGTYNGAVIEENEGTNAVFSASNAADQVFPFSIGAYISEVYTKTVTAQQPGSLVPEDLTNGTTAVAPIKTTTSPVSINTGLPSTAYRLLYNVVKNGSTTGTALPSYLVPVFGNTTQAGWICSSTAAATDIKNFGFLTLSSSNCGALTTSQGGSNTRSSTG
jgi:ABC-type phosphate transport system substrate-binding protein